MVGKAVGLRHMEGSICKIGKSGRQGWVKTTYILSSKNCVQKKMCAVQCIALHLWVWVRGKELQRKKKKTTTAMGNYCIAWLYVERAFFVLWWDVYITVNTYFISFQLHKCCIAWWCELRAFRRERQPKHCAAKCNVCSCYFYVFCVNAVWYNL